MPGMSGTSSHLRLPDFVGLGTQKAATTYLWRQLSDHPEVMAPNDKELRFFFRDVPVETYAAHFADVPTEKTCGEITPSYLYFPQVPGRIDAVVPDARLFVILRDPTERAFSQWLMLRQLGRVPLDLTFREAFDRGLPSRAPMADRGLYAPQLERYGAARASGRLLVLWYDDLVIDAASVVRSLYRHIGVDPNHRPRGLDDRVEARDVDAPVMTEDDRRAVVDFYRASIGDLEAMTGRDLSAWAS